MDGLSGIFNAIKPVASVAAPVAGLVGNLLGQQSQNAYTNQQTAYQAYLQNLAKNPAALSAMINKATLPLSGALVQGVNNQVQGDLASRGLSQAPGIFAATEEQALAPYLLSQQDQARQQVMQQLGLGQGQQPPAVFPGQSNMTAALMQALKFGGSQPQSGLTIPTIGTDYNPPPQVNTSGYGSYPPGLTDILAGGGLPTFTGDTSSSGGGGYGS